MEQPAWGALPILPNWAAQCAWPRCWPPTPSCGTPPGVKCIIYDYDVLDPVLLFEQGRHLPLGAEQQRSRRGDIVLVNRGGPWSPCPPHMRPPKRRSSPSPSVRTRKSSRPPPSRSHSCRTGSSAATTAPSSGSWRRPLRSGTSSWSS